MVDTSVTTKATPMEFTSAGHTSGAPQGLSQFLNVKPTQVRLLRPASLKEKANV